MPGVIHTIKQNCRKCYTCVRDCPAKAIRIVDGQASVVSERCISCGNCTLVCTQGAKAYCSGVEHTEQLLGGPDPVAILLAPSFPADFPDCDPASLVAALRRLGFHYVVEVAQGADLVSLAYRHWLESHSEGLRIATACPAVVEYVRKYNPALTPCLIPIVSPMITSALEVKRVHGPGVRCVFVGPCVAKKQEAQDPAVPRVIDEVLTFQELRRMLQQRGLPLESSAEAGFDEPRAGLGRVYPLVGGLLRTAGLERDPLRPEVMVVSGQSETVELLGSLRAEPGESLLVEAMMCRGCYSGPGMALPSQRLVRKKRVADYVNQHRREDEPAPRFDPALPGRLHRTFAACDQRLREPTEAEIKTILARTNKFSHEDELNCGACGYPTCRAKAVAVSRGMAEEAMCLPFMIEQAERLCHELKVPSGELRDIHRHLINTEKLASMGQMAAGVAHELNNPLSTIMLYANIVRRKLGERTDLNHDLHLLEEEAQRCKKIIGMLLDFARQNRVKLESTSLADLLRQAADESQHAADRGGSGVRVVVEAAPGLEAELDRDQMAQVLGNLIKNAVEAMDGREGAVNVRAYEAPETGRVHISVADQGCGIPQEARDKIFQPFFTTKSIGKGTGLGLPISYGIVKMHRGTIWFESVVGSGTIFHIELPKSQAARARSMFNEHRADDSVRG